MKLVTAAFVLLSLAMPAAYTPLDAVPVVLRIALPHHAACAPVPILRI